MLVGLVYQEQIHEEDLEAQACFELEVFIHTSLLDVIISPFIPKIITKIY